MKTNKLTIMVASLGLIAACGGVDDGTEEAPPPGGTAGNEETTFDHENGDFNPFDLIDRLAEEGPPRFTARVHSCPKVRVRTLGNVLTSLGVNMGDATNLSAAQLYNSGYNALGGPNYANRIRENINITTSSASREFDVFAAASDQIITAFETQDPANRLVIRCPGARMFDPTTNACRSDGISCLIGVPADAAHLDFCNITVTSAADVATGKRIAVAALLAAAYTCE